MEVEVEVKGLERDGCCEVELETQVAYTGLQAEMSYKIYGSIYMYELGSYNIISSRKREDLRWELRTCLIHSVICYLSTVIDVPCQRLDVGTTFRYGEVMLSRGVVKAQSLYS